MTVVAIHCSSQLTPTEHSTHLATSTESLSTFPGERKTDRETEREGLTSLNYITCHSTANCLSLRVQQRNYICFIYVGNRTAES